MAQGTSFPLRVYYDGDCAVCRREMQVYQQRESGNKLIFFDISAPGFNPEDHGRKLEDFMRELHVRDASDQFHTGISAFARIWSAFPDSPLYSLLERTVNLPGIRFGAELGYTTFARLRHLLPKTDCHNDSGQLH